MWASFSTVVISDKGEWNAHSMCFSCKSNWHWTMHPDKPLNSENVVLRARFGDGSDDKGYDDPETTDDD